MDESEPEASGRERKVPVLRSANSLIEDEFHSLRGRFDEEMRLMELEMERFKSQLMSLGNGNAGAGQKCFNSSTLDGTQVESAAARASRSNTSRSTTTTSSKITTTTTTTSTASSLSKSKPDGEPPAGDSQERVETTNDRSAGADLASASASAAAQKLMASSPLVVEDETSAEPGAKMLRLRFDVSQYEPEQIVVKTIDNRLQVEAKRQERAPNKTLTSEYKREFLLPSSAQAELIKSSLSADGVLTIEAPLATKTH